VSTEGYPTELSIEVTVTYKKDTTTIRRILSVPLGKHFLFFYLFFWAGEQLSKSMLGWNFQFSFYRNILGYD
jgi:hypothetical protein